MISKRRNKTFKRQAGKQEYWKAGWKLGKQLSIISKQLSTISKWSSQTAMYSSTYLYGPTINTDSLPVYTILATLLCKPARRPDQTRPDPTWPDQTRPDQTRRLSKQMENGNVNFRLQARENRESWIDWFLFVLIPTVFSKISLILCAAVETIESISVGGYSRAVDFWGRRRA